MFFWSMSTDLDGCWSVDASRRGAHRASVPAFGLRRLELQIIALYYATARLKVRRGWLNGVAIYQMLQLDGFVRPFGAWLEGQPNLGALATYVILAMEVAFPFFALSPFIIRPARAVALALGAAIQLGIAAAMRVGIFQEAMLASCALFILPEWLVRFSPRVAPSGGGERGGPRFGNALGKRSKDVTVAPRTVRGARNPILLRHLGLHRSAPLSAAQGGRK